jgi:hypothetical protein
MAVIVPMEGMGDNDFIVTTPYINTKDRYGFTIRIDMSNDHWGWKNHPSHYFEYIAIGW